MLQVLVLVLLLLLLWLSFLFFFLHRLNCIQETVCAPRDLLDEFMPEQILGLSPILGLSLEAPEEETTTVNSEIKKL